MIKRPTDVEIIETPTKPVKIGDPPPETPPGVVYLEAEMIDDSFSRYALPPKENT